MGGQMTKILPSLYVGNLRNALSERELKINGITHVLSILESKKDIPQPDHRSYLKIGLSDSAHENISDHFIQSNKFIHGARVSDGICFVHCMAGASRSVTLCIAYIITLTDLPYQEVLDSIRGFRHVADPNYGFQRQLRAFQASGGPAKCRQQLEVEFGTVWPSLEADISFLRDGLELFQNPAALPEVDSTTDASSRLSQALTRRRNFYRNLPPERANNDGATEGKEKTIIQDDQDGMHCCTTNDVQQSSSNDKLCTRRTKSN